MKRVLVTGASGFLGSAIVRDLTARGWDVIGTSSTGSGAQSKLDLFDAAATRALLRREKPTHLVHSAWRAVHGDVMRSPDNLRWLGASLALVQAFREEGGQRAAVLGSSAEYDWSNGICKNNETPLRPATIYGACKLAMHIALEAYARDAGLGLVWPRVFFVYGPGEHETRLVASVIRSLVRGEPAECTSGLQVRDYMHVADVAAGIVAALESEHVGAIDIASGVGIAVRDLVTQVASALGREDLLRLGARPSPVHDVPLVLGDPSEASALLGFTRKMDLVAGIADTVAWGREKFGIAT